MPGWIGEGVATPLPGLVVVVAGRVVLVVLVVLVVSLVVLLEVVGPTVVVVGTGSERASTQYDRPAGSVPQFARIDGF